MSSSAATPRAASQRSVPFRARRDLIAQQIQYGRQSYWVLKDPLRNELYRLRADQYAIYQLLDGQRSLEEIRDHLVDEFRGLAASLAQLQEQVTDLVRKGLVWSTRSGQSGPLAKRQHASRRQRVQAVLSNPLFIRLPGWDPQRFLDWAYPAVRWMFYPQSLLACAAIVVGAWCYLLVHFDEFRRHAPTLSDLWRSESLLLMWGAIAATKALHELGHAFACKQFGGECHEIGVALMIFSPSLYCDVSDAGRIPDRRARIAVGAAGMAVELFISSAAFAVWWNTSAGVIHDLSWTVFLVSHVSVVAFNLNPLLRLDGYYMLSDWLGVPNLRSKADGALGALLSRLTLGTSAPDDPSLPDWKRRCLIVYAVASMLFRWQMVALVTIVLYRALTPIGLQAMGLGLGLVAVAVSAFRSGRAAWQTYQTSRRSVRKPWRPKVTLVVVAAGAAAACLAPFPVVVTAPLVMEPAGAHAVYVSTPGRLQAIHVRAGQFVKRGDVLAQLSNREMENERRRLLALCEIQKIALEVHTSLGETPQAEVAEKVRSGIHQEVQHLAERQSQLTLRAPCDGIIVAAPRRADGEGAAESRSLEPTGDPLEAENLGAYLPAGTHLLTIQPHAVCRAVLLVDQFKHDDFARGEHVRVKLDDAASDVLIGVVEASSVLDGQYRLPHDGLASEKWAAARAAGSRAENLAQVVVRIASSTESFVAGQRGEARRTVFRSSLAGWLWRQARLTFRFL